MTGQTPVALWEPALERRSLPSGMPLTETATHREATVLDSHAIGGLLSGGEVFGWLAGVHQPRFRTMELYPHEAPTLFVTPSTVSSDALAAYAEIGPEVELTTRGISIRYALSRDLEAGEARPSPVTGSQVLESVDRLRESLHLSADVVAALIGLSRRRYYELRAGGNAPLARLAEIRDRVELLNRLASIDAPAVSELCRQRTADIAGLLSEGRHAEVEELARAATRRRATLSSTERPEFSGPEAEEMLAIVEGPAFQKVLRLVRFLTPIVDAETPERAAAALQLEKNIQAVEVGDPVDDEWEFLLVMRPDAIASLRDRAAETLRDEGFDRARWSAFIADESDRAWAAHTYQPAGPVLGQSEDVGTLFDAGDWQPDLSALGVDLSAYDRRAR